MNPAVKMQRPVTTQTTSSLSLRTSTPKVVYPSVTRQLTPRRCCETGRPIMMDPLTGAAICSCQLKAGVPAYLSRVPTLPETVYGTATGHQYPSSVLMGAEASSAFYQMGLKQERQSDTMKATSSGVTSPYYLEHLMAAHPYNSFYPGFDLSSARRKNATRETTSALKAWLYEHRKNPYPTKGEKIMLAIITRMTLTQVSTWFANARRRLKKESKMEDKDIDLSDIDVDDKSESQHHSVSEDDTLNLTTDLSDISDAEESAPSSEILHRPCVQRLLSPDQRILSSEKLSEYSPETQKHSIHNKKSSTVSELTKSSSSTSASDGSDKPRELSQDSKSSESSNVPQPRPKIWSITEIISSPSDSDNQNFAKRQLD